MSRRFSFMLNRIRNNPSSVAISPPRTVSAKPRSISRFTIRYGSPRNGGAAATAFSAVSSSGVSGSGRKRFIGELCRRSWIVCNCKRAAVIAPCAAATGYENIMSSRDHSTGDVMTPEEALRNILKLVEGSDELEDAHAMQILLQSIKTLAEKGLGRSSRRSEFSGLPD